MSEIINNSSLDNSFSLDRKISIKTLLHIGKKSIFLVSMVLVVILYMMSLISVEVLYAMALVTSFLIIYETRYCKPIALMSIFLMTYTLNLYSYYFDDIDISGGYSQFDMPHLYDATLFYHTIFLVLLYLFLPKVRKGGLLRDSLSYSKNNVLYLITLGGMLILYSFGVTGENIIESGGYTKGKTGGLLGLSLNEYFVLFLPIAYRFAGGDRWKNIMIIGIASLFCIKVLLFGGRVAVVQTGLMLYILFFDSRKLSLLKLLIYISPIIYLLLVFGALRGNPFLLFERPEKILMYPITNFSLDLFLGNQNDVFYSSVRLNGLVDKGIISFSDRIQAAIGNVLAIVVPYKFLPDITNLAGHLKDKYGAGGGALFTTTFYICFSWFGLVFIAYYLARVIKKTLYSKNQNWVMYGMMVMVTYPRWVGYNIISMFKMSFYVIPAYFLIKSLNTILKPGR